MKPTVPNLEAMRANPSAFYTKPADILKDDRLSLADKRTVLDAWAFESKELQVAEGEGFDGGEDARLREVELAREALDGQMQQAGTRQ